LTELDQSLTLGPVTILTAQSWVSYKGGADSRIRYEMNAL
jgi:hypothetical protein